MTLQAEIDLDAFGRNVARLRDITENVPIMLMVKANAYGHGVQKIAERAVAAGCEWLGVLEIEVGRALRKNGVTVPLFAWLIGPDSRMRDAIDFDIDLGISASWQIDMIVAERPEHPVRVHLKIDTGLHRNGATIEEWPALVGAAARAAQQGFIEVRGIWSHLADVSLDEDRVSLQQLYAAIEIAHAMGVIPAVRHLAASSAGIRYPEARLDLVRLGIAAYGVSPFDDRGARDLGLEQVMTLRSRVARGADAEGRAIVEGGFADGVHPAGAGSAEVLVGDRRARVMRVGPTSFEIAAPWAREQDEVTIFGSAETNVPSIEEWATWADTVGDEILTRIPARIDRQYISSSTI